VTPSAATGGTTQSSPTQNPSNPKTPSAPLAASGFGAPDGPTDPNPNVFSLSTYPHVDGQSGALTQTLKLDIPPGRNGLQPDLALQYNSQRTEDSIVGYGWAITIPYIQRLNKTGSQNLYNVPYFTSSIDGELATSSTATSTQTYVARIDNGSFNSYSFSNNVWTMYDKNGTRYVWTMYDKNGTRYLFGASDNSQQNASASSTQIYKWMLQEIRDTNNNYVRFVYSKDSGQIYPSQIVYTGNGSTDGSFEIDFTKSASTRSDTYSNYLPGFLVTTNYTISKITASVNGAIVREYNLAYTAGNNGYRSLLHTVQENGWDANHQNEVSLPATSLSYINDSSAFASPAPNGLQANAANIAADVNGNSKLDLTQNYIAIGGAQVQSVYPQGGTSVSVSIGHAWSTAAQNTCSPLPTEHGVRFLDTSADGKADIAQGEYNYTTGASTFVSALNTYATSTGYSWNGTATGTIPYFDYTGSGSIYHLTTGIFGDVNGDGLPDYEQAVSTVLRDTAYLGNGSLWDPATTTIFQPKQEMPVGSPTYANSQLVDVNGDGLPDWVYSDSAHTYVLLNNGHGWDNTPDAQWTIATSTLYTDYSGRGMRFVDISGDGLPDFIRSYTSNGTITSGSEESGTYQLVLLNTGNGWATSTVYNLSTPIISLQNSSGVIVGVICGN
jgi:hypothetical protein